MTTTRKSQRTRHGGRWIATVVLLLACAGGVALYQRGNLADADTANLATRAVRRGPMTISVTESGTIKALDQRIIKVEVEGQTTIIYLVDEGTRVNEGDLLVELDASKLVDTKLEQQIRVQNAEAAFIRAREQLEVVRSQTASDIARAELDFQFAQEDQVKYLKGEYPNQLREAQTKVTLADEDLKRTTDKYEWSKKLFEEKYLSETEFRADELAQKRSGLEKELAEASLQLLQQYTHKRKITELQSEIDQMRMALDRVKRKASADIVQAEADLKAKEAEFLQQKDKLVKIDDQIAKTKMVAPAAGMVVYATSARGSWRGNETPLDEGQTVRERQELIYLPTADAMMAEIQVHESSLEKVKLGLPVELRVDALPGQRFTGVVARIAPLPDAQSMWMNPDLKVYRTTIHLTGNQQDLRTGMSCQATIIVSTHDDVLQIPVQAVVRHQGQPTVYVIDGNKVEPRAVEIGMDNNAEVMVKSGLTEGDRVLLTPPLTPPTNQSATTSHPITAPASPDDSSPGTPVEGAPAIPPAEVPDEAKATEEPAAPAARQRSAMTDEQREEMRKRMESMSPEEREQMREQFRQRRSRAQTSPE